MSDETKNKPALEDNFAELEDILKQMEQPEISLEQSFLLYQSGVEKLKECNVMLDTVEEKDADFKCQRGTGRFLRCRRVHVEERLSDIKAEIEQTYR